MGIIFQPAGVTCDDCGATIASDKPAYVVPDDDHDLVFCSLECVARNMIEFDIYSTVGEYLRTVDVPASK